MPRAAYVPHRMNFRLLATFSLTFAAGIPALIAQPSDSAAGTPSSAPSAAAPAAPAAPANSSGDPDHTELGDHMKKAGRAFKALRRQLADPSKNDSSLQLIAAMKTEFEATLTLKPAREADLPADQQADFQGKFVEQMKQFLVQLDKLSDLIKAGDNADAAAQVKTLGGLEHKDHKEFRKPEKD